MFDIKAVKEEAAKQVAEERGTKAKNALVAAYRKKAAAQDVVRNSREPHLTNIEAS